VALHPCLWSISYGFALYAPPLLSSHKGVPTEVFRLRCSDYPAVCEACSEVVLHIPPANIYNGEVFRNLFET